MLDSLRKWIFTRPITNTETAIISMLGIVVLAMIIIPNSVLIPIVTYIIMVVSVIIGIIVSASIMEWFLD